MSVAICRSSAMLAPFAAVNLNNPEEMPPGQLDIWTSIQSQKANEPKIDEPYVHPLLKRSSSLMSQKSLEICTESLGSETGSDGYFSSSDDLLPAPQRVDNQYIVQEHEQELDHNDDEEFIGVGRKEQAGAVNYHCSIGSRSPRRSFPPPLPSISCRDGPCLQMRPRREDGRLVVEAVAVPSQNYLRAERQGGRLLLSFINSAAAHNGSSGVGTVTKEDEAEDDDETKEATELEDQEEEEEEVEVVDRGTVVEVKVSTQPQQHSGGASAKVHRSSIVINKFVSCTPASTELVASSRNDYGRVAGPRRSTTSSTTAAAAAVAASTLGAIPGEGGQPCFDNKLLFTSKRRNREELLHDMRRCSQLRKPLFIWEPCCIATSSS